jgi:2,5-diamino-6-(ribosylamino)-4(3H)-pyrimidinone 5'-phosphate reductase
MMSSVDGRIQQKNWGLKNPGDLYEQMAAKITSDGWIVGRVTMEEFSSTKPRKRRPGKFHVPKGDFVGDYDTETFAIAIDPHGKLKFDTNRVDTEHVITVVTGNVSAEYLDYLRSKQVSYIIGGKKQIDLRTVVWKLAKYFPIKRLTLQGGGGVNGSFLKAGLIDELYLLVLPVADGSMATPTVFDAEIGYTKRRAAQLRLRSAKVLNKNSILLKYAIV